MSQKTAEPPTGSRQFAMHPSLQIFLLYILLPVLTLAVLLSPPVSLADRLSGWGYQTVPATGGRLETADGMALVIPQTGLGGDAWLQLEAVPRAEFIADKAADAAAALPPDLTAVSPYYRIKHRGTVPQAVQLAVPVSPASSSATVDLYVWDGQSWQWRPHQTTAGQTVEAELDFLPAGVVLFEPSAAALRIAANTLPETGSETVLDEFTPGGLTLAEDGQLAGSVVEIPETVSAGPDMVIIPVIGVEPGTGSSASAIDALLRDANAQRQHIESIVALVEDAAYQGIELDYRAIDPDLREAYTEFAAVLRKLLPAEKQLVVRVDMPTRLSSERWDTGAYDWPALGQIADAVKISVSPQPDQLAPGEETEALVAWAVRQIDRRKLQLLVRTHSTLVVGGALHDLSDEEALAQIGQVAVVGTPEMLNPGQSIDFTLAGLLASTGIRVDKPTGVYWFAYLDRDNRHHTVYLGHAATVEPALELARQYHLRGVALQNLPNSSSGALAWQKIDSQLNQTRAPAENEYSIAWRVQGADGKLIEEKVANLQQNGYSWQAPESGGSFEVIASILSGPDERELPQGKVVVQVATPTSTPSPTATPTRTPRPTRTPTRTPTPTPEPTRPAAAQPQQRVAAAPPPAVKAVNIPFGYGIQADPRGRTPENIGHIQRLGFQWVKFQMAWKDVESAPGDFSWAMWDQLIDAYSANGIKILLSIPKAPDWARPADDDRSVEGPPQDPNLYAQFVGNVAGRYRGRVQMIEVWNEQNLWYEAGGVGRINAANYVQLLQLSYRAIKQANPDMIVVSGALTPAGNVGEFAVDDIEYLRQMYANGARGFFDALGAHPSGYNCPAGADWRTVQDPTAMSFRGTFENRHHSWCFRGTMEGYRNVMVANGDGAKAIVPTEFGWAVSGNPHQGYEYARDNTPEEQARWIVEAYQLADEWGWVGPMFLWNLDYGETAAGTELAAFGILGTPAFEALAGMPK